jgi:hypothetical protein
MLTNNSYASTDTGGIHQYPPPTTRSGGLAALVHPSKRAAAAARRQVIRWGSVGEALEAAATLFAVPCGEEWSRIR